MLSRCALFTYVVVIALSSLCLRIFHLAWSLPEYPMNNHTMTNLDGEVPEQMYALSHFKRTDSVITIGGNVGRACVFIDKIVDRPENSACVEPIYATTLAQNKKDTSSKFKIIDGILERRKGGEGQHANLSADGSSVIWMLPRGLAASVVDKWQPGAVQAKSFDIDIKQYNVALIDCEGCYCFVTKDFPEIFAMRAIIIEWDGPRCIQEQLLESGFIEVDGSLPGAGTPKMSVWVRSSECGFWCRHIAWLESNGLQFCFTVGRLLQMNSMRTWRAAFILFVYPMLIAWTAAIMFQTRLKISRVVAILSGTTMVTFLVFCSGSVAEL
eukprot:TRINITY_DN67055_c0_g1_i1.p1 TRINITY_DN67055_c0_g1~~TRINITY_DN67055_c0_g1_i1.p1  ORF type:complete len:326 (+),score=32.20 TRINITY_DN67055_c0_g1_i1:40-1017(+)